MSNIKFFVVTITSSKINVTLPLQKMSHFCSKLNVGITGDDTMSWLCLIIFGNKIGQFKAKNFITWWCHGLKVLSALLDVFEGNTWVTDKFLAMRTKILSPDHNKLINKTAFLVSNKLTLCPILDGFWESPRNFKGNIKPLEINWFWRHS